MIDAVAAALKKPELPVAEREELYTRLRALEDVAAVPALLGLLGPGDPHGLRSEIVYALDRLPEAAYFDALLAGLPDLVRRAPGWAFVALVRIVNTREGDEDSCAARFERAARAFGPRIRELVRTTLQRHVHAVEPDVAAHIRQTVEALAAR
jgi:hypothetical protein